MLIKGIVMSFSFSREDWSLFNYHELPVQMGFNGLIGIAYCPAMEALAIRFKLDNEMRLFEVNPEMLLRFIGEAKKVNSWVRAYTDVISMLTGLKLKVAENYLETIDSATRPVQSTGRVARNIPPDLSF